MDKKYHDIKVSLIIPVYNSENFLRKCLRSVLNQSIPFYEIIIVNDGSTDRSADIISEFKDIPGSHIRSYTIANSGCAFARLYGLKKCTGNYAMFLDSDDSLNKEYLESYLKESSTKCSIIATGEKISELDGKDYANRLINETRYWGMVRKLYSRDLLKGNEDFFFDIPRSITIGEDILTNIRIARSCKKVKCIAYDGYCDGVNIRSVTRRRNWSFKYEQKLFENIRQELGDDADIKSLWLRELRIYRALVLHSNEDISALNQYRKELVNRKPSNVDLSFVNRIFAFFGLPIVLRKLYNSYKSVK